MGVAVGVAEGATVFVGVGVSPGTAVVGTAVVTAGVTGVVAAGVTGVVAVVGMAVVGTTVVPVVGMAVVGAAVTGDAPTR